MTKFLAVGGLRAHSTIEPASLLWLTYKKVWVWCTSSFGVLSVVGSGGSQRKPHLLFKRPGELFPRGKLYLNFFKGKREGEEKGRELEPTNHYHLLCFTLRAMGSQQAKSKQTLQLCFTLRSVSCDWKRREDWTTTTYLKIFHHTKDFNSCYFLSLQKRFYCTKLVFSKFWRSIVSDLHKLAKWFFFLILFRLLTRSPWSEVFHLFTCTPGKWWWKALWMSRRRLQLKGKPEREVYCMLERRPPVM